MKVSCGISTSLFLGVVRAYYARGGERYSPKKRAARLRRAVFILASSTLTSAQGELRQRPAPVRCHEHGGTMKRKGGKKTKY